MDFEWLKTFVIAAKTENFHETARQRFLNQATVSHHIARLEAQIGVSLFARDGRRVRLTPAGAVLLPYAEHLLAVWEQGSKQAVDSGHQGSVTLAFTPYTADILAPWLYEALARYDPQLDLNLRILDSEHALEAVLAGSVDGGFLRHVPTLPMLHRARLINDGLALVLPPDEHDWDHVPPTSTIERWRQLVQPSAPYWAQVRNRLHDAGYVSRELTVNNVALTKKLIEAGIGYSVLPELACRRESMEGRLVLQFPDWLADLTDPLYWVTLQHLTPSKGITAVEHVLARRFPHALAPE